LSAAFAYLSDLNYFNKGLVFLSAIPIAVTVNVIRLAVTAFMARWLGAEAAQGFLHELSGLLTFIVGIGALMGVYLVLSRTEGFLQSTPGR
jgi:exosortase/archaeosortase family protein